MTRSADTRLPAATALHNALAELDMEDGPHTLDGHEMAVNTLLADLRKAHFNYVETNALKIEDEPHKSYLVPFHTKLERVLGRARNRLLPLLPVPPQPSLSPPRLDIDLTSNFSSVSTKSISKAYIRKLDQRRRKLKTLVGAVEEILAKPDIAQRPRVLAKIQLQWSKVEGLRQDYASMCMETEEALGEGNPDVEAAIKDDQLLLDHLDQADQQLLALLFAEISPTKSPGGHNASHVLNTASLAAPGTEVHLPPGVPASSLAGPDNTTTA